MSGCFPSSPDINALWSNLRDGRDCVGVLPLLDRWGVSDADVEIAHAGVIEEIEYFQSAFFDISQREAAWMDPQQRLLMVHVWKAIEDAGYAPRSFAGKNVAVLIGTGNSGYATLCAQAGRSPDAYSACGSVPSIGPNRISNLLDLRGPSEPIETACSSSLVALHRGVTLLQGGQCDSAIVGGVNTIVSLDLHAGLARAGMLSPDGRCRPFSAGANGYVRGEGVGILLLKRLSDAERDGDHIHGLVLGSAENHCGKTASLTAPNSLAQAAVIRDAIHRAGVDPATITYVEAHGTGTPLGDPIEVKGLTNAFASLKPSDSEWEPGSCALGSIKGNIGHLELSAGIAGVIKVLLQMKHRTLAMSLHADSPNPHIDFSQGPFHLVKQTQLWPARVDADGLPLPRRAGVSSFGFGGVNAHVVLEEYVVPTARAEALERKAHVIVLSADSETALKSSAAQLAEWVDACEPSAGRLEQVAYTLQVGRNPMEFRLGFEASSLPEVSEALREYLQCGHVLSNGTFLHGRVALEGKLTVTQAAPEKMLENWIQGSEVDWGLLYFHPPPTRMSLPTYPFKGERFWPVVPNLETMTDAPTGPDVADQVRALAAKSQPLQARNAAAVHDALRGQVIHVLIDMARSRGTKVDIDPDAEFGALGFDSLDMADLGLEIREKFGFEIDTTAFFAHPTLRKLGDFITDEFNEALVAHFSKEGGTNDMLDDGTSVTGSKGGFANRGSPAAAATTVQPASVDFGCGDEPVAIVGMSGAFPMSPTLEELWSNLKIGKDCIGRLPLSQRWNVPEDSVAVSHAGVLESTEQFDPLFFGISPREAEVMDPQQRLLMMHAWAAIEDSGHAPQTLSNERVAVVIGTGYSGYGSLLDRAGTKVEGYSAAGMAAAMGPNRTNYFLNLRGPSEPVDTACSSSLVALHRAVQLIRNGECTSAIAGGVNTLISLDVQKSLAKAGMLSPEGRCKTFSSRADGYVRSEGVGMLYIKSLTAAQRDGDHIYALIKGSAVNHGGRTASLTAPSPQAQSSVVKEAMHNASVDPATITYVEAHGTGTPLGDPVEVSGLTQAFRETAGGQLPPGYCGIGSIKSNVGHLEMCAGVAGVIKVLLQMKHGTLVKSLHADELNERIDFESSPFFVVREVASWNRLKDQDGREIPRRAGVSSFGFGGVNAHVVLEEYLAPRACEQGRGSTANGKHSYPIVLSARTEEALRDQAQQLLSWVSGQQQMDAGLLERLAYTLQVGRDAMEHRLGFLASSRSDLIAGLTSHVHGTANGEVNVFQDIAAKNRNAGTEGAPGFEDPRDVADPPSGDEFLRKWVIGMSVDWKHLHHGAQLERLSLPTYPFKRERYWPRFPDSGAAAPDEARTSGGMRIENVSVLNEVRFRTKFYPLDSFLRDHLLAGRCVVPAAVAIEMSRQAITTALALEPASELHVRLTDIMFSRPMWVPDTSLSVILVINAETDGGLSYFIRDEDGAGDPNQVYCRGRAEVRQRGGDRVDLRLHREQCQLEIPCGAVLYRMLAERGLELGPTFQTLSGAWRQGSQVSGRRALAHVATGQNVANWRTGENCNAEALDGALQLVAALDLADGQAPGLPFAVESVEFRAPLPRTLLVTLDERLSGATGSPRRYDISICDEQGAVCVSVSGFVTRVITVPDTGSQSMGPARASVADTVETMLFRQVLLPVPVAQQAAGQDHGENTVILCDIDTVVPVSGSGEDWRRVEFRGESTAEGFLHCTSSLFTVIAGFAQKGHVQRMIQVVVPQAGPAALLGRLEGALRSISDEYRSLRFQLLLVPKDLPAEKLVEILRYGRLTDQRTLVYSGPPGSGVSTRVWQMVTEQPPVSMRWKDGGVYLITGGLGQIGRAIALDITNSTRGATVVLVSRDVSTASDVIASLKRNAVQANIVVRSLDVGEQRDCSLLVSGVISDYGRLDGILHCAGIVEDAGFMNRPQDGLCRVLRPKALGVVNLDLASAAVDLDFFVCFSSLASSHGNPGQVDYAASNAFMDAFMDQRAQQVRDGTRQGQSLSVNWPLWRDGGMRASAESARRQQSRFGMVPIRTEAALIALRRALALRSESGVAIVEGVRALLPPEVVDPSCGGAPRKITGIGHPADAGVGVSRIVDYLLQAVSSATQVHVENISAEQPFSEYGVDSILALDLTTELEARFGPMDRTVLFEYPTIQKLARYLASRTPKIGASHVGTAADADSQGDRALASPLVASGGTNFYQHIARQLRTTVANAVGMPLESISDTVPFSEYGVDSILVLDLTTQLEQDFGRLEKTLFFEYPTIRELAEHLSRQTGGGLVDEVRKEAPTNVTQMPDVAQTPSSTDLQRDWQKTRESDIAVVGMSGRYPQSLDLEHFWENLLQGTDCIQEIPTERWDWRGRSPRNRWGGFIEGVDRFDPLLFNISPRDAERIDPQERLFLQCAFAALEDAGYTPDEFGGGEAEREVGVFVGVMYEEYQLHAAEAQVRGLDIAVSGSAASVANRVSYSFNFRGPSIALDTMCSSSLTAIHLACQSIRNGDCKSAIAGGVNVSVHPNKYLFLSQAKFESTDGRCASFGRGGNGYVPAEGVGAVVLKKLSTAILDGDHIYGVIRGSAINSGGRSQGYTAPSPDAQAAVIAAALRRADVDARDISYVEAHGTGTQLGDPIEIAGLTRAFGQPSNGAAYCAIGSVKSNIGHAEAAAGIAGFTKVLLQMKHQMLVPSIHSDELNPLIDFDRTPFRVQQRAEKWEVAGRAGQVVSVRRAAVSSFGAGGANAHIILEEHPETTPCDAGERHADGVGSLFILSARTQEQLCRSAARLLHWLKGQMPAGSNLMDVAYTLQIGRVPREFRLGIIATTLPELLDGLSAYLESSQEEKPAQVLVGTIPPGGASQAVDEEVLDALVRSDQLRELLSAWVAGANPRWRRWHSANRRRISLPTYPFAEERYWIETGTTPAPVPAIHASPDAIPMRPARGEAPDHIRRLLSSLLQVPIEELDDTRSLEAYGIDSILLMEFSDELSSRFGIDLSSAELYLQPTIDQLVAHIASRVDEPQTDEERAEPGGDGDRSPEREQHPSSAGQFVGLRLLSTPGAAVAVFYPTHASARAVRMGAFTLSVAVNAHPIPRVKGLIVICHGREGSQLMHHDLAEQLASAGYVVAALEHPTDSWKDTSLADSPDFFLTRPREALEAIDAVIEHPSWETILRDLPIGIVAHSAGAIDALSLLGARVTVASAAESPSIRRHIPGAVDVSKASRRSLAAESLLTPDLKDPRIQACVLLAPFTEPFDRKSLSDVDTPIRIYLAEKDETLDNGTNGYRAQKGLRRCEVVMLPEADHYSFIAPNSRTSNAADRQGQGPTRWSSEIEAFFHEHFAGPGSRSMRAKSIQVR